MERFFGDYVLSTDAGRLDIDLIEAFLRDESYWARGISGSVVERSIRNSFCFGVFHRDRQVAFARVVTDRATFAHVMDVFVVAGHRGRGLAKLMMGSIMEHPDLQGLRRWSLGTDDAHELYGQFGFRPLAHPERMMEITRSYESPAGR